MYIPGQNIESVAHQHVPSADERARKKSGAEVYFQGNKKNELNDIKQFFKNILHDPDKLYLRKEIIKKMINYTTQGVDTSRIFPQMVLASATKDPVEKKMIYFYLSSYSLKNENFARMAINTFLKDSYSSNPKVRALSIKHLSNLRFKGREEYIMPNLRSSMSDFSSLVRKSCIMGLTKLISQKNRLLEEPERDEELLNELYSLIRDADPSVVCTALEAINEIEPQGLIMNKKLANYLLDNLNLFDEYQLPVVLKYYELYEPKTPEETVNAMNILYGKIRCSVLSVTLAISKIYLRYAELFPEYLDHVLEQIKKPLFSFLNNDCPEVQYVALKHIEYILRKYKCSKTMFASDKDIKKFYLLGNEKTYTKLIKVKIIELNVRDDNFADLINELAEYVIDEQISKDAIGSMERIMMTRKDADSKFILKTIVKMIEQSWNDYLCNNALPAIRNYLRRNPSDFEILTNIFYTLVSKATEDEAKCAMIEIIGDYGEHIEDAIELIAWNEESSFSDIVKISLLRVNVKLFFKRPIQMLNVITNMFNSILSNDETHLHVRDYASFLYKGLQNDIQNFKKLFLDTRHRNELQISEIPNFEINSLEIVYEKPVYKWLIEKEKYLQVMEEMDYGEIEGAGGEQIEQIEKNIEEEIKNAINVDSSYRALEAEDFDNEYQMDAEQFEANWEEYEMGSSITRMLLNIEMVNEENLEELFKIWHIGVMASAEDEDSIKLYLYCRVIRTEEDSEVAMMEFEIQKLPETMTMIVKSENEELAGFVSKYVEEFLRLNEII